MSPGVEPLFLSFFVEEKSAEITLRNIIPKMVGGECKFRILSFQGKYDLLSKLPHYLKSYPKSLPDNSYIIVLIDRDNDDCRLLKQKLEAIAKETGLFTKSNPDPHGRYQVINRIVIEELEAWFFGDIDAIQAAYPRIISRRLGRKQPYRDPDAISGGTWEALEKELKKAGYYRNGMPKIETARKISEYMLPIRNRSKSFQVFMNTLKELC